MKPLSPTPDPAAQRGRPRPDASTAPHSRRATPRSPHAAGRPSASTSSACHRLGAEVRFVVQPPRGRPRAWSPPPWGPPPRVVGAHRRCHPEVQRPVQFARRVGFGRQRGRAAGACQRRQRLCAVCHGPYRVGRSRHGAPVRSRQQMASTISRSSRARATAALGWRRAAAGATAPTARRSGHVVP